MFFGGTHHTVTCVTHCRSFPNPDISMQMCGYCDRPTVDLKVSTVGLMEGALVCVDCRAECALCGRVGIPITKPILVRQPRGWQQFRERWRRSMTTR